jgi:hypothetical protein
VKLLNERLKDSEEIIPALINRQRNDMNLKKLSLPDFSK